MSKIEAKFLFEDPGQLSGLQGALGSGGLEFDPLPEIDVVDRYLDTPDWRVLGAGWTYCWREAAGKRQLRLKSLETSNGAVSAGEELVQQVTDLPDREGPQPEGQIAQRLGDIGASELQELFRVHNHRRRFQVRAEQGTLIELAIDQVTITATATPRKLAPGRLEFQQLEMQLQAGPAALQKRLADELQQRLKLLPSRLSNFERGLQTVGLSPPLQLRPPSPYLKGGRHLGELSLGATDLIVDLAYRYLFEHFQELLVEEPKAWEGLDPEGVHQMRVATRRIRAAFRELNAVLPAKQTKTFSREFKWVAAALGEVRDLDVYQQNFQHYTAEVAVQQSTLDDYRQHLSKQWKQARRKLLACLQSERYERLQHRFAKFLARGPSATATKQSGRLRVNDAAAKFIGKQHKKVLRSGRQIGPDSPEASLHRLRIDCKRLRYLLEFVAPVYGGVLAPFIKQLKRLQIVLGDFQDACVATQELRRYADSVSMRGKNRDHLIALKQLINSQRSHAAERRADFHRVWSRFDVKGRRQEVLRLLR